MKVSADTEKLFELVGGELYYFNVSGHNGHSTKFQLKTELDAPYDWVDVPDDEDVVDHTTAHQGNLACPAQRGQFKLIVTGGTGDVSFNFAGVRSFSVN